MGTAIQPLQARENNRQINRSITNQRDQASLSLRANETDRTVRRNRLVARRRQVEGARRVAAGQAGTGQGGTLDALGAVEDYITAADLLLTNTNAATNETGLRLRAADNERALRSQKRSTFVAGTGGFLSDVSTGLSIYGATS